MSDTSLRRIVNCAIFLAVSLLLSGCPSESVSSQCETVVDTQCEACFACAGGDGPVSGADMCGLVDGETEDECRTELQDQCEQQSRLLRDPYEDLDACDAALADVTCDRRLDWVALDQERSPVECRTFLY